MAIRASSSGSWFTIVLVAAAVVLWALDWSPTPAPSESPTAPPITQETATRAVAGGYEKFPQSTLVEHRQNDGDSFVVRLPNGREEIFRLYFVDAPESAFRRYANGETNTERIRQQAHDMGGLTPEQTIELGRKAKRYTLELLASRPFTLFTRWDSPFKDNRFHAHIEVVEGGKSRWLDELLMERGFVRIKTKPADLPDGTPAARHLETLRRLRKTAG